MKKEVEENRQWNHVGSLGPLGSTSERMEVK